MTAKTLHFPTNSGLSPRPYDAYDAACEKLYWSYQNNLPTSVRARREAESILLRQFHSDCLDTDFTHGKNIARKYRVTVDA